MKTLRKICAATILSLTLSVCVLAGQIESNGAQAPAPPPTTTSTATTIIMTVLSVIYP